MLGKGGNGLLGAGVVGLKTGRGLLDSGVKGGTGDLRKADRMGVSVSSERTKSK